MDIRFLHMLKWVYALFVEIVNSEYLLHNFLDHQIHRACVPVVHWHCLTMLISSPESVALNNIFIQLGIE